MSRATSGRAIFADNGERWLSNSEISASIVSGSRAFLMILTRGEPSVPDRAALFLPRRVPRATAGGSDRSPADKDDTNSFELLAIDPFDPYAAAERTARSPSLIRASFQS